MSVRQRAVDLLYAMCDRTNAETIVQEMLNYLESADYSIREEMVRTADMPGGAATDATRRPTQSYRLRLYVIRVSESQKSEVFQQQHMKGWM